MRNITLNQVKNILITILLFVTVKVNAQVGIGINHADSSAILQVQDTAKGLLIPRMTAVQRTAIAAPAEGLLVYQTDGQDGFWYFRRGVWQNMSNTNNGGKHTLVLSDNITNAEAQARIASDAGPNTPEVKILRCTNLTTVDLSMLTSLDEVFISNNTSLQTVNLNNLQTVYGGILVENSPAFTKLSTASLKSVGLTFEGTYGLKIANSGLKAIEFPLLNKITGDLDLNNTSRYHR